MVRARWCAAALALCSVARADVLSDWTDVAVQTAVANKQAPFVQTRTLAMVHLAVFEAVNAIAGDYQSYTGLPAAPPGTSMDAAIAQAAHDTLAALYPSQRASFDAQLADDLRRYLDHEPVRARPQTLRYRASKFVRRNRVPIAAASAVVLTLSSLSRVGWMNTLPSGSPWWVMS